jgi:hypothetical protein
MEQLFLSGSDARHHCRLRKMGYFPESQKIFLIFSRSSTFDLAAPNVTPRSFLVISSFAIKDN